MAGGDLVLAACKKMNAQVEADYKAKNYWTYWNSNTSKSYTKAIKNNNRKCNCALGACWAFKLAGAWDEDGGNFYGSYGTIKGSESGQNAAKKTCTFTNLNGSKTVNTAMSDGTLQPGDMVMYTNMQHTNIYAGNKKWYDMGHAYCKETGDGAKFPTWYGGTCYGSQKISWIIRYNGGGSASDTLNDSTNSTNRVWVGDSRTVGMEQSVGSTSGDTWICKSAMGYNWFVSTAIPKLETLLKSDPHRAVIMNLGVNDCGNTGQAEKYSSKMNELISAYPDTDFYYMAINPYDTLDSYITQFNSYIKSNCKATYIDSYTYLKNLSGFDTSKLHYSVSVYKDLYNYTVGQLKSTGTNPTNDNNGDGTLYLNAEAASALFQELFNFNIKNNVMTNGTITVKGLASYKVGERVIVESDNMEYYVESVTHNFNCYGGWTTQLGVTRGIEPENRFTPPWGCSEEMTPKTLAALIRQTGGEEIDWSNLPETSYTFNGTPGNNGGNTNTGDDTTGSDDTGPQGDANTSEVAQAVFNYCKNTMGFNNAACCAVLANIECESGFKLTALGDGGTSYGLCQWHNGRWTNLKNYCSQHGLKVDSVNGQMKFLEYELKGAEAYTGTWDKLKGIANTAQGAYDAAYHWCYYFERPDKKEQRSVDRGNLAKNTYWPSYKNK